MKKAELENEISKVAGRRAIRVKVNGRGDLFCDADVRHLINKTCIFVKQCKSGLIQIAYQGKMHSLPLRNLDLEMPVDVVIIMKKDGSVDVSGGDRFAYVTCDVSESGAPYHVICENGPMKPFGDKNVAIDWAESWVKGEVSEE